ncbi:MAG TPA: hypothetical protein VMI12_00510 [Puia sp.]|nr:hypothetical protein [Puia sp.]
MKQLTIFAFFLFSTALLSCNNESSKEETKATDTAAAAPAAETKPAFSPFKVAAIVADVKNFDKWKEQYFLDDSLRKAYGITHVTLGRDLRDSNKVYVLARIEDMNKAMTYSKLPSLREAGKTSTLKGKLGFSYAEIIRADDSPVETEYRLGVAHHVKDFNAWLKVFDGEGSAARASTGVVDRSISRDLVDSNMIYLSFAVTDTAKARARMKSPDLKKIMDSAGVDSPPTVRWYRIVK